MDKTEQYAFVTPGAQITKRSGLRRVGATGRQFALFQAMGAAVKDSHPEDVMTAAMWLIAEMGTRMSRACEAGLAGAIPGVKNP